MNIFCSDCVTVVRKKGDRYMKEDINTTAVLPGGNATSETIRRKTIERLRNDESVFLVLEGKQGVCKEEALHPNGFLFHIEAYEGEKTRASLRLSFKDSIVYAENLVAKDGEENDVLQDLADDIIDLLECIQNEDYDFVSEDCPYFTRSEPEDPLNLLDAGELLKKEGYQTERISTVGYMHGPFLFVHENEVILLGSHGFDAESLFLEMKRLFQGITPRKVTEQIEDVKREFPGIRVIHWEDGSWSFRIDLDEDFCRSNFKEKLLEGINELRKMISTLEDRDGMGCEPWSIVTEQRHLFIYETVDASLKYSKINI